MKKLKNVRVYEEERERLNRLAREISAAQNAKIGTPEILRRTLNIPGVPDILKQDAMNKRGKR